MKDEIDKNISLMKTCRYPKQNISEYEQFGSMESMQDVSEIRKQAIIIYCINRLTDFKNHMVVLINQKKNF